LFLLLAFTKKYPLVVNTLGNWLHQKTFNEATFERQPLGVALIQPFEQQLSFSRKI
jgi:hypothetical protein